MQHADEKIWKTQFPLPKRIGIILISYFSFFFSASLLAILILPSAELRWRLLSTITLLYLFPAVCARLLLVLAPLKCGIIDLKSSDFITWWVLFNLQVIFCRFPLLEELLRLIPGIYGPWLRLWGAEVGRLTYWAPGLKILDRPFVKIGDDVVFGADVRLNPHVVFKNDLGKLVLALDYVTVGSRTLIGGYSLFTAGTTIFPDQATRAYLILPPFSKFRDGKRDKKEEGPDMFKTPQETETR
jgi:hypothetical protein